MNNEKYITIGKKALFFKEKNIEVHVALENNQFYNGCILDVGPDFLILKDRKLGEVPVFFLQLISINPFINKEEVK